MATIFGDVQYTQVMGQHNQPLFMYIFPMQITDGASGRELKS